MSDYKIFIIGAPAQHEEMVELGEYEKSVFEDIYSYSNVDVTIADVSDDTMIKENFKNMSESNIIFALQKEDGSFDKDSAYLIAFAEYIGRKPIHIKANFFDEK